ncbi:MAG: hypothetical protein AB2A00_30300 [Myxococcota bacterium]
MTGGAPPDAAAPRFRLGVAVLVPVSAVFMVTSLITAGVFVATADKRWGGAHGVAWGLTAAAVVGNLVLGAALTWRFTRRHAPTVVMTAAVALAMVLQAVEAVGLMVTLKVHPSDVGQSATTLLRRAVGEPPSSGDTRTPGPRPPVEPPPPILRGTTSSSSSG